MSVRKTEIKNRIREMKKCRKEETSRDKFLRNSERKRYIICCKRNYKRANNYVRSKYSSIINRYTYKELDKFLFTGSFLYGVRKSDGLVEEIYIEMILRRNYIRVQCVFDKDCSEKIKSRVKWLPK